MKLNEKNLGPLVTVFIMIGAMILIGCGETTQKFADAAAKKALDVYIERFLGDIDVEATKQVLETQKEELVDNATTIFFNDPGIVDLELTERIRQSVMRAANILVEANQQTAGTTPLEDQG